MCLEYVFDGGGNSVMKYVPRVGVLVGEGAVRLNICVGWVC